MKPQKEDRNDDRRLHGSLTNSLFMLGTSLVRVKRQRKCRTAEFNSKACPGSDHPYREEKTRKCELQISNADFPVHDSRIYIWWNSKTVALLLSGFSLGTKCCGKNLTIKCRQTTADMISFVSSIFCQNKAVPQFLI